MTHANSIWKKTFAQADNIVHRKIAGEELLVPIRGELADMQRIFTLNAVGGQVWKRLDGKLSLEKVAQAIFDRFDADREQVEEDVQAFVSHLVEAGLAVEV